MSTRTEFDDEGLSLALERLAAQGRLRDYVLLELYAMAALSVERLMKVRVHDLRTFPDQPELLFITYRGGLRKIRANADGLFAIHAWIQFARLAPTDYLFPATKASGGHLCARRARMIIESQFQHPRDDTVSVVSGWRSELDGGFTCRVSRWPWVECVRAQSGDRCVSHCEGLPVKKHRRPFRTHGMVTTAHRE